MDRKAHWDRAYEARSPTALSWYQPHLQISLDLIEDSGIGRSGCIIDVGGGASSLVDDLLEYGYEHVTVLDISEKALAEAKARLGARAGDVNWIEGDVTQVALPERAYDLWHDRAVFHFLTDPADRRAYVKAVRQALKPGGSLIVATFAPMGPERCSGLPVARYGPEDLAREFGEGFRIVEARSERHHTPAGKPQEFTYARFERT
jgi:SAM-dependent methyltransferase